MPSDHKALVVLDAQRKHAIIIQGKHVNSHPPVKSNIRTEVFL